MQDNGILTKTISDMLSNCDPLIKVVKILLNL